MNEIQALAKILQTTTQPKTLDASDKNRSESLMDVLYKNTLSGKYKSDEEAAQDLYGTSAKSNGYQVLKSKLKNKLLADLLVSEPEYHSIHYFIALLSMEKELLVIKKLLMFGARTFAIRLTKRLLLKAEEYTAITIQLQLWQILREHYWYLGERKNHEDSIVEINRLRLSVQDELRSYEIHESFSLPFVRSKATHSLLIQQAEEVAPEMQALKERTPSYEVILNYYRFNILRSQISRNFSETIRICDEIEEFFNTNYTFIENVRTAEFLVSKAEALLYTRNYEEAERVIERCITLIPAGKNNWFAFQTLALQISFHAENWQKALRIFDAVTTHERFALQPDRLKEEWKIYEAFLLYILPKKQPLPPDQYNSRIFQLYTFLNEVPIYSLDKAGANIAILILQTIWTIKTERYDRVLKLQKTLNNYCVRYLKSAVEYERGAIFLKMLRSVISNDFNKERIEKRTEELYQRLTAPGQVLGAMEFYPYERLWTIILSEL